MTINLMWGKYKNDTILQLIYLQFVCVYVIISNLTWEMCENETILQFIIKGKSVPSQVPRGV